MIGRTGDASPVSPAVVTPLDHLNSLVSAVLTVSRGTFPGFGIFRVMLPRHQIQVCIKADLCQSDSSHRKLDLGLEIFR